eukprot:10914056-Alexandrium_andersonii.AAC.1
MAAGRRDVRPLDLALALVPHAPCLAQCSATRDRVDQVSPAILEVLLQVWRHQITNILEDARRGVGHRCDFTLALGVDLASPQR